ncbi:hypothetical protein [Flavobacterium sp.]|uniref:hypothetical protein n=1 Tax=Flavobacterium sp. TaxID=239 RepID=UPI002489D288|nr:hypothetical protein [Flavobacterium sp.]MDI1318020.1 hypothetical protein [Flavobacterium sp.]
MKKRITFAVVLSFLFFGSSAILVSCQKKEVKKEEPCPAEKSEKKLEMYQMSEMAALMEQMYVDNQRVKANIKKGEAIGKFPEHYQKIFSSKFTDESDNDEFFKEKAADYIAAQKLLYTDPNNQRKNFNAAVDACIACHMEKCGGPIPKIKKLYLKE